MKIIIDEHYFTKSVEHCCDEMKKLCSMDRVRVASNNEKLLGVTLRINWEESYIIKVCPFCGKAIEVQVEKVENKDLKNILREYFQKHLPCPPEIIAEMTKNVLEENIRWLEELQQKHFSTRIDYAITELKRQVDQK